VCGRGVLLADPVDAPRRPDVLPQELPGLGIEQADVQGVPLHREPLPDPAGRGPVIGRLNLDAAVEMDGAHPDAVVAKRLERQRPQRGPLLGKHRRHLALGRAVDPGVRPVGLPPIQVGLRRLQGLEAEALQRRLLGIAYFGPSRTPVSADVGHRFRSISDTRFARCRTPELGRGAG
jgi:hypothetical protein